MDNFGQILRDLRLDTNLSQKELGKIFDTTQDTISLWEKNKRYPDFNMIKKIALYFDVSTDYLLQLEEEDGHKTNLPLNTKKTPSDNLSEGEREWLYIYHHIAKANIKMIYEMVRPLLPKEQPYLANIANK